MAIKRQSIPLHEQLFGTSLLRQGMVRNPHKTLHVFMCSQLLGIFQYINVHIRIGVST